MIRNILSNMWKTMKLFKKQPKNMPNFNGQ